MHYVGGCSFSDARKFHVIECSKELADDVRDSAGAQRVYSFCGVPCMLWTYCDWNPEWRAELAKMASICKSCLRSVQKDQ